MNENETGLALLPDLRIEDKAMLTQVLSESQANFLLQRTPERQIKYRQGRGNTQLAYVPHGYVTAMLNHIFGFRWNFEVLDKMVLDDEVIVEGKLTVTTPKGDVISKTQFGGADIERFKSGQRMGQPLSIADNLKAAGSDALKKCASLLGIGLDLYWNDEISSTDYADEPVSQVTQPRPQPQPAQKPQVVPDVEVIPMPRARITPEQIAVIVRLLPSTEMTLDGLLTSLKIDDLEDLSEAKAANVIKRLQEKAQQSLTPVLDETIPAEDRIPMEPGYQQAAATRSKGRQKVLQPST